MTCDDCIALGIPKHLCRQDRPNINEWEDAENLYRRHNNKGNMDELIKNPDVVVNMFEIHNDSYNRSTLSEPEDVLYNDNQDYAPDIYSNYGIIEISVGQLRKNCVHQINNDERVFSLVPIHDSKDCNYSHSEIHCFIDGEKAAKKPRSINAVFRQILIGMFSVIKEAS